MARSVYRVIDDKPMLTTRKDGVNRQMSSSMLENIHNHMVVHGYVKGDDSVSRRTPDYHKLAAGLGYNSNYLKEMLHGRRPLSDGIILKLQMLLQMDVVYTYEDACRACGIAPKPRII